MVRRDGFRTYLFDLDGTLIDSVELILRSYRHAVEVHLGYLPADELWIKGLGTPLRDQLASFSDDPKIVEAMVIAYRDYNRRYHDELLGEYPGVRDALDTLRRQGFKLGVVTSKRNASARRGLARCGFDGLVEVVVGADDVERHKPDPFPVLKAIDLLGATPSETVFVGDSPHDIAAGRRAGVATAAALWGPVPRGVLEAERPDYWLSTPSDIVTLIDR